MFTYSLVLRTMTGGFAFFAGLGAVFTDTVCFGAGVFFATATGAGTDGGGAFFLKRSAFRVAGFGLGAGFATAVAFTDGIAPFGGGACEFLDGTGGLGTVFFADATVFDNTGFALSAAPAGGTSSEKQRMTV
jgi:hypothetical protein